jgi:hypothetical protein
MTWVRQLMLVGLAALPAIAQAWVYPEHRDIAVLGVEKLNPERRAVLDRLWAEARTGHENRVCATPADSAQALNPKCIDWAALSAIAGDHSCSAAQLIDSVENSDWILDVAAVAAQLKVDLAAISVNVPPSSAANSKDLIADVRRQLDDAAVRAQRINALRTADVKLQHADPEYATRAGSNNAHFLLPRPTTTTTGVEYLAITSAEGAEVNAIGIFARYHVSALQQATRLAHEQLTPEARAALARAMLADEAFALHFLEDVYAAGHVAGTWGNASQRKGTHDYYNEYGLEASTWNSAASTIVLLGDAHMRPEDADRAAATVSISLGQLLDTAAGLAWAGALPYSPQAPAEPVNFDVCKNNSLPPRTTGPEAHEALAQVAREVLGPTPMPSLGQGLGAMPRFRAELGPFIGVAGVLDARRMNGGFTDAVTGSGGILGADLSVRVGLGLEGVLGQAGDGLIFLGVGYRGDAQSTNKYGSGTLAQQGGSIAAAIPARSGFSTRLRMPFYLVPGDLLILSPLLALAPKTYQYMAVTAVNGGLIPWQLGWATRLGRFQLVAGREIGVAFYGREGQDTLLAPGATPASAPLLVGYKSTFFDFPLLEYRPYRAFDVSQASAVLVQLFYGLDVPSGGGVILPSGMAPVRLHRESSIGLRVVFDWRRYY